LTTFASLVASTLGLVTVVFVEPLKALSEGKGRDIRLIADADAEPSTPHAGRGILFPHAFSTSFEDATLKLSRVGALQTRV